MDETSQVFKPCPQCGGTDLETFVYEHDVSGYGFVRCKTCNYFNSQNNWQDGQDPMLWDTQWISVIRRLEKENQKLCLDVADLRVEINEMMAMGHKAVHEMTFLGNTLNWPREMQMSYAETINELKAVFGEEDDDANG